MGVPSSLSPRKDMSPLQPSSRALSRVGVGVRVRVRPARAPCPGRPWRRSTRSTQCAAPGVRVRLGSGLGLSAPHQRLLVVVRLAARGDVLGGTLTRALARANLLVLRLVGVLG
eukprot:scaffold55841_cov55-Phaeocystis_antarctica.AAC.5